MCEVIAVTNQKGGVGKTTTALNLGVGLARKRKKVLLIDADSQGSLTSSLGYTDPDELTDTFTSVLLHIINEEDFEPDEALIYHKEGVFLLPGNSDISGLELTLRDVMSREYVLKAYIDMVRDRYDYILIDCSPSLGLVTVNALAAADSILIPVQTAYLAVLGLEKLLETIAKVKRRLNRKLMVRGILLTMVDFRPNFSRDIASKLAETYGESIGLFQARIPFSIKSVECSSLGISIFTHCPEGKVAKGYELLTEEILQDED